MLRRFQVIALAAGLASGVAGIALNLVNLRHLGAYTWQPISEPLRMEQGAVTQGRFTAQVDEIHLIEFQFDISHEILKDGKREVIVDGETTAGSDGRRRQRADDPNVLTAKWRSDVAVDWVVSEGDRIVARGDGDEALYISVGGRDLPNRVKRRVLGVPFHREGPGGSASRGVGRFRAEAGVAYDVAATMRTGLVSLEAAGPRLSVRLDREFFVLHAGETLALAIYGIVLLLVSGVAWAAWVTLTGVRWFRGREQTS